MFRLYEIDMNNIKQQRASVGRAARQILAPVIASRKFASRKFAGAKFAGGMLAGGMLGSVLFVTAVNAAGEVSQVQTVDEPGTPTQYTIDGRKFSWGMGSNQIMEGFEAEAQSYQYAGTADRVEIVRHDVNGVSTGNPCGVFVEKLGTSSEVLKANYPSDGSDTGNCDMAAMLAGRVVNRGALNLFSNTGDNPKNVERVDYIYDSGVLAPLTSSALSLSGHVVAEKSGNNPLQIAAITEVDVFGQPAAFGPLVFINRNNNCSAENVCYGITNLRHNYAFFQNNSLSPQGFPSFLRDSTEPVGMAFVSLDKLGIDAGQVYYGFSYFADDVDPGIHTLTNVTTFPNDTNDKDIVFGDGPDIYGGVAGYYLGSGLSIATGAIFKDENGNGQQDGNEAGIGDISLTLFEDTNDSGVFEPDEDTQLGPEFNSDANGEFRIPGLEDGIFFLELDESDADFPPALEVVSEGNPAMIVIQGNDADGVTFGVVSETGPTEGTDAGASDLDAGASDVDAGAGDLDAGATDVDAGAGDLDAGATDVDAGAGDLDAGATDVDVDAGDLDAGATDVDVGTGDPDAGATDVDAGTGDPDAGAIDVDAGTDGGIQNDDADAETVANPDAITINQGDENVRIDVLMNDTDASGGGLTIVGTPESQNGTITVDPETGELIYTPDFGFIGTDSFLYIIEDADGTQSTGTVSVEVLRFADLNENGVNDFVECNCDNLTIEVGVEGSALGGSSLFSFLILTFMVAARRVFRTRRASAFGVIK